MSSPTGAAAAAESAPAARDVSTRDLLWAAGAVLASAAIMSDAWFDIFRIGTVDEEYGYVLLAPVMIIWLAWGRRTRVRDCPLAGMWVGLLIVLAGWLTYAYGYVADPVLWRAGAVLTAVGAVVSMAGFRFALRFAPALFAAVFLIPVSSNGRYRLAEPLQRMTTEATQNICDLFGIYVDRAGNLLSINGVEVTIAEACNGMRMILTLFLVCYVVAFSLPLKTYVRVIFLAVTPLVAVASNVVRLVPTVWMFGHKSPQAAEQFHDVSGWVMTFVAFLLLMGFFRVIRWMTDSAIYQNAVNAGEGAAR